MVIDQHSKIGNLLSRPDMLMALLENNFPLYSAAVWLYCLSYASMSVFVSESKPEHENVYDICVALARTAQFMSKFC